MDSEGEGRRVQDAAAAAEEQIGSMVDSAQQSIVEAVKPAKQSLRSYAEQHKTLGAEQLDGVARAAHRAAHEVEEQMPAVARSVHQAAERVEAASSSLREQSPDELLETVGSFARSRPAIFFGGAVLAGFALARFLKTSARRAR
jgi:methyl-accepting chemotaxis protein